MIGSVIRSFYSAGFYHELGRCRKGMRLRFVFFLTLLITLYAGYEIGGSKEFVAWTRKLPDITYDMPAITFREDVITIDARVPYRINLGDSYHPAWLDIDTDYQSPDKDDLMNFMTQYHIMALITSHTIIMIKNNGMLEIHDLKGTPPFSITHDHWHAISERLANWGINGFFGMLMACFFVIFFIFNLVITFFTSLAVLLLGLVFQASLDMAAAMRLAGAMLIPSWILPFAATQGDVHVEHLGWIVWGFYLVFSVWCARRLPVKR